MIGAVYMLRAYRAIFMGAPHKGAMAWIDPTLNVRLPILLLIAMLLLGGFFPGILLSYIKPSVEALLAH